jgi:hypothetical protein
MSEKRLWKEVLQQVHEEWHLNPKSVAVVPKKGEK